MARSVFHDLFSEEEAAELEMRAKLLSGINKWLSKSELTQTEAAEQLGVTQARVSEIKNGKINRFIAGKKNASGSALALHTNGAERDSNS